MSLGCGVYKPFPIKVKGLTLSSAKLDYDEFELGDFTLESGEILKNAKLAYKPYGRLNDLRNNTVLLPTYITGNHTGYECFIGEGKCFDPAEYFILAVNQLGNGFSTSPSNARSDQSGSRFPRLAIRDNVNAQYRLVTQGFQVTNIALVAGFSMGALQAFQWSVSHPDMVSRVAAWCGHARTSPHTRVFLNSLRATLEAAVDWDNGDYALPPLKALRALAYVYAPWGLSQAWYRREGWKQLGCDTLDDLMNQFWLPANELLDPNDYLAQAAAWFHHDVGQTPGFDGDWQQALSSISANTLVMPCRTDLYFPCEDAEVEANYIPRSTFSPIESDWGHFAGIGIDPDSTDAIDVQIKRLMSE